MDKLKPESTSASDSSLIVRSMESAKLIPVALIDPNPNQPRHEVSTVDVAELAESIKANGLIEPLVVSPIGERYQLIAGYRRLTAFKTTGLTEVPCIIRTGSDAELLELALLENIQRSDLTYIEEAESYKRLMAVAGINQATLAQRLNKPSSTINDRLALLALPQEIREMAVSGKIPIKAALELGRVGNPKRRASLASRADRMTLDELKSNVQKILEKQKTGRKKHEKRVAHPLFKELFAGLPVKRVYKDHVTFVFREEDEFIDALRKIIERFDSENRAQ